MTIQITQAHNEARLQGTLGFLDTGSNNARVRIYGGTRPASVTDEPGTALLVEIELTKPSGTINSGLLSLTQLQDGLIQNSGIATWARAVNGNNAVAFDCDAGEGPGAWEVQLAQAQLFAGGDAKITSAVLG
jgi:hypothetical protein